MKLGSMMEGIVTTDPVSLEQFMTAVAGRGTRVEGTQDRATSVAFAFDQSGHSALSLSDDGWATAVSYLPPLAAQPNATAKAEATLRRFRVSTDPIENPRDQCSTAVWTPHREELILYRDWRGSPPLYYSVSDATIMWSTSIRALLALGVGRAADPIALAQLQQVGYVPAPRTMVIGISKIPAGYMLSFRRGQVRITRHWQPPFRPKHRDSVSQRAARIKEILSASIADMASSAGPTGVLLSGGIDSVVVSIVASKVVGLDVEAFTFRYEDYSGPYNEGPAAKAVADTLGIGHTEIGISPSFVMDRLPHLVAAYEEPMTYGLHSARLEPLNRAGVDVALSGADAPFFNMPQALAWALRIDTALPRSLVRSGRDLTDGAAGGPVHRANTLLTTAAQSSAERYFTFPLHKVIPDDLRQTLYSDPDLATMARADLEEELARTLDEVDGLSPRDDLILLGLTGSAPEHVLTWNHRWGATAGVSVRLPLCDDEFVGYMSRRPMASSSKEDLRMLAAEYIPAELAHAPKIPQTIPIDEWFRGPMEQYVRDHLDRRTLAEEGMFDPEVIQRCLEDHIEGRANHKWVLWTCLTYIVWRVAVLEA